MSSMDGDPDAAMDKLREMVASLQKELKVRKWAQRGGGAGHGWGESR